MFWPHVNLWLPALTLCVALPAVSAYVYYRITGDPAVRPLAVTIEGLASFGSDDVEFASINVRVAWGDDANLAADPQEVRDMLARALDAHGARYWFTMIHVPGKAVTVRFVVGASSFGPFPVHRAASGIDPAIAALHMIERAGSR